MIVEADADLDYAAQRCAAGGFGYAGQTCISVQRVFVHQSIADLFTTKLLLQVARLKSRRSQRRGHVVGPLIDQVATHRVGRLDREKRSRRGRGCCSAASGWGRCSRPRSSRTSLPTMKVSCQEVFGPVVTVTPYRQFDEAIPRSINRTMDCKPEFSRRM